jgi:hypothetical protein
MLRNSVPCMKCLSYVNSLSGFVLDAAYREFPGKGFESGCGFSFQMAPLVTTSRVKDMVYF